jgi:uracil-DNA glycosylase
MDNPTAQQLADWLQFFRDLGIEDVYERAPQSGPELSSEPHGAMERETYRSKGESDTSVRTSEAHAPTAVGDKSTTSISPSVSESRAYTAPLAQSLTLFETTSPLAPRKLETLEEVREDLGDCRRCKLWGGRKNIVFGEGNPRAELVLVGEGPGADEDEQGLPFVGRAGQLLNRMLQLVGIKREDVYICNVVKCRPPANRTPEADEISACSPFLFRQIEAIHPRLVCCLGAPAAKTVLGIKEGITKIHGRLLDYGSAKAMATVHPAYVLRNMREEIILREDFQKIREFLKQGQS